MKRLTYRVNTGINDVVLTDKKSVDECLEWGNIVIFVYHVSKDG